jgi:hypothetical protein
MSMRQLHESDSLKITVTDENGKRQGILVARSDDWCWVLWDEMEAPTTEHIRELWICDKGPSLYDRMAEYAQTLCKPQLAVGA